MAHFCHSRVPPLEFSCAAAKINCIKKPLAASKKNCCNKILLVASIFLDVLKTFSCTAKGSTDSRL